MFYYSVLCYKCIVATTTTSLYIGMAMSCKFEGFYCCMCFVSDPMCVPKLISMAVPLGVPYFYETGLKISSLFSNFQTCNTIAWVYKTHISL